MKKFFITNLIFLLSLNIFIKSFWILGIDRSVQNALSSADYGIYYALLNFTYIFNIILDLGITSFNNRTIAQNNSILRKYFSKIFPLKLLLALVYAFAVLIIGMITGYDGFAFYLLKWLCIFQILSSLIVYLRSNISALLLFKTDSILSVMDKTLTIIFCSILLWTPLLKSKFKVEYFVYAQVLSLAITALVALIICLVKTGFVKLNWDSKFMKTVLKYGFPYALLALLMSFYNRIDGVMLERILRDSGSEAGIYASGFRLVDSAGMVSYLFSVILLPLFAKMIKNKENIREIIKVSSGIMLLLTVGFVAISQMYGTEIMTLMYNKNIPETTKVFRLLSFCFIPISYVYIYGTLLTANGSLKYLNIVAASGMVINFVLNFVFIPRFGAVGSALTDIFSQGITCILQVIIAMKIFNIKVSLKYALRILLFVILVAISTTIIHKIEATWAIRLTMSLCIYVIIAFVLKIFDFKQIKELRNEK